MSGDRTGTKTGTRTRHFLSDMYFSNTERRDTEAGHFYLKDGREVPGVTGVLDLINKPQLLNWKLEKERDAALSAAADLYTSTAKTGFLNPINFRLILKQRIPLLKQYQVTSEKEAGLGTQVHRAIEWQLKKMAGLKADPRCPFLNPHAAEIFTTFKDWAKSVQLEPLAVELPLVHPVFDYGCTLDFVARINGEVHLVDVKTSRTIWKEYWLQLHAQRGAWESQGWDKVGSLAILKLPKDKWDAEGKAELVPVPIKDEWFNAFIALLAVWEFVNHATIEVPND